MNTNRLKLSGREEFKQLTEENVIVGEAFAFLDQNAVKSSALSWVFKMLGQKPGSQPYIISLAGPESVELFGYTIAPLNLQRLVMQSIVSDKSLYRQEKDTINLLVLNPLAAKSAVIVVLRSSGTVFSRHSVQLGMNGEGTLKLRDLPVGEYDLVFDSKRETACQFVVAQYRLVPLVASLIASKADGEKLDVTLQVESFGVPINGQVRLSLLDRLHCVTTLSAEAEEGRVNASFVLSGEGPHVVSVQLSSDPSKTATVPLRGSRESERSHTVFSSLGTEVVGSLLPIGSSKPVRGIYFAEGALKTSPVSLDRVDDAQAHLTVNASISMLKAVVVNPAFPRAQASAVDVTSAPHPGLDPVYKKAEAAFNEGDYQKACELFEERGAQFTNPHPYYAYSAACCYAKTDKKEMAVNRLHQAFVEGWTDLPHMESDEDLASLRGYAPFDELLSGGMTEVTFSNLSAGQKIAIEAFAPASLLLIGAFVEGKPWEGWASIVTPSAVSAKVTVPDICLPGEAVSIEIETDNATTSVFAIVKDARLISPDTPELKLAAAIKKYVEAAGKDRPVGYVTKSLKSLHESSYQLRLRGMYGSSDGPPLLAQSMFDGAMPAPGSAGSWSDQGSTGSSGWGAGAREMETGSWNSMQPQPSPQPSAAPSSPSPNRGLFNIGSMNMPSFGQALQAQALQSQGNPSAPQAPPASVGEPMLFKQSVVAQQAAFDQEKAIAPRPQEPAKQKSVRVLWDDPEVLFAGFVKVKNGKGVLKIKLPDVFAEYIVECFAIAGVNWVSHETRFKVARDPFVQLTTPVFTRLDEPCLGTVNVGSSKNVRVRVICDGKPVELFDENKQLFNGEVSGAPTAFTFVAAPGQYEAIVENKDGTALAHDRKRVDEPGKLKRIVRSLRLVEPGQTVNLKDDLTTVSFNLLPGIDTSFDLLVDATADYSHCCCEQTAAKILSGCAMYMLANGDVDRRTKAESIILAGIRREKQMWLQGRGFMSYPDRGSTTADQNYGPKAARYLWNLGQLTAKGDSESMSQDLKDAIKEGLSMAEDTTKAYGLPWPPNKINSCEDAYGAVRFGQNGTAASAVSFVQKITKDGKTPDGEDPYLGRAVFARKEAAYAAATLLRSGGAGNLKEALTLANKVIGAFNEQGRLYSTVDSVAAIALMSELKNAGVTKGGGKVEINGKACSYEDAMLSTELIKSVKVLEGLATVAVDSMVEEDWSKFSAGVPLRISLEKDGQHTRNFTAADTIDLVVTLEDGYTMGDLLWVALPDSLSRVIGGGQVKLFSIDFAGQKELRISLAATGVTEGIDGKQQQQSLAVCVRNMFQEERAGNPGLIPVSIAK